MNVFLLFKKLIAYARFFFNDDNKLFNYVNVLTGIKYFELKFNGRFTNLKLSNHNSFYNDATAQMISSITIIIPIPTNLR